MLDLEQLGTLLETNDNFTVTKTENGLLISDVNEEQNVPADLINFIKIYETETNVIAKGNGYVITTQTFSGQTFMMLLMSVYGAEYNFEVTGEYEVTVTKKSKEGVREEMEADKVEEVDFLKLAEAIDADGIEIEIHEDGLKVVCINKSAIAEKIDSMNPTLNIEITNDFVLVTEGE